MSKTIKLALSGLAAGAVNGLFGAGGGMILVPLLSILVGLEDDEVFPASVMIILPICLVSLLVGYDRNALPLSQALPYLLGAVGGGLLAIFAGNKIPVKWLHRFLGLILLYGGIRYLC